MSTKRTTARKVTDINGEVIRLYKNHMSADNNENRLEYREIRNALKEKKEKRVVRTQARINRYDEWTPVFRAFGPASYRVASLLYNYRAIRIHKLPRDTEYFRIGCHVFNTAAMNRIFLAAGIVTNKQRTAKRFAAAA